MDDQLVTPEAVVLDLPVASVPTRALAALLDLLLQGAVLLVAVIATAGVTSTLDAGAGRVLVVVGGSLLVFLVQLVYPTVSELLLGGTLGHLALGLRVVTVDGGPPDLRATATRTAVGILELEGTAGVLALLTATLHPRGRRLGDLAAGTLVVRTRTGEQARVHAPVVPGHLRGWAATVDAAGLGPEGRAALRRYLDRRDAVAPTVRRDLAEVLLARLLPAVGATRPAGVGADDVVVALAAVASTPGPHRAAAPPPAVVGAPRAPGSAPPAPPPPPRAHASPAPPGASAPAGVPGPGPSSSTADPADPGGPTGASGERGGFVPPA